MRRQIMPALVMLLALTVVTGIIYPLVVTGVAQVAFGDQADGSLLERDGEVVGSRLIGQSFTGPGYFHPRPSAAGYAPGPGYSYGSNWGPTNEDLLASVADLVAAFRQENGLSEEQGVPVDAVTASGSGLDPHISVANATLQAPRVAAARGMDLADVEQLIVRHTDGRGLGILGEPAVNVLELNLALDG